MINILVSITLLLYAMVGYSEQTNGDNEMGTLIWSEDFKKPLTDNGWVSTYNSSVWNPARPLDTTINKNYVEIFWPAGSSGNPQGMGDIDYKPLPNGQKEITMSIMINVRDWKFGTNHHMLSIYSTMSDTNTNVSSGANMPSVSSPNAYLDFDCLELNKGAGRSIMPGYVNRGQSGGDYHDQDFTTGSNHLDLGVWYEYRVYIKLNTLGTANGILKTQLRRHDQTTWTTMLDKSNLSFNLSTNALLRYPSFRMYLHGAVSVPLKVWLADWKIYQGNHLGVMDTTTPTPVPPTTPTPPTPVPPVPPTTSLETDVSILKTDVSALKTKLAAVETKLATIEAKLNTIKTSL